jgi:protoporphyrinogen oxidase
LGYVGVIDERIDLELIGAVANARPDWQIVLVGPHVKIDPNSLPRAANIQYFGQQAYEDLPKFLAGWDVCLQPFALNESTQFISPTKTLEYMAALRPIVSTPITDVVEPYGHIVRIANDATQFIDACESALSQSERERDARIQAMEATLARTSWDDTAQRMYGLIESPASAAKQVVDARTSEDSESDADVSVLTPLAQRAAKYSTVVLGAGPTGLSAAYHLGEGSLLLEQNSEVGGWCRSIEDKGFTFDYAGHIMFSNDPYVHEMYKTLLGSNVHWQNREAWIYSNDVYTRYPFQSALHGLPANVLKECIVGAIEARFGSLKAIKKEAPKTVCSSPTEGKPDSITDCCGDGVAESTLTSSRSSVTASNTEPANFEEFIYKVWGSGVAKHFAIPYNRKLWATPLNEMETSWLGGRVPLPDLEEMIEGALRPVDKPIGPNARFGYPLRGGFQALMNGFVPLLKGDVRLNAKIVRVLPSKRMVVTDDGACYRYETLISTLPLPALIRMMKKEAPDYIVEAVRGLRHVSVRCVNLGIGREHVTDKHWIYYPGDSVFHRIFVQGNASPHCNPHGGFGLTCEITYSPSKPLPCDGQALIDRCIADCVKVGIINKDDPIWAANQIDMPYAYVVYDHARKQHVETIRSWLATRGIVLAGRYSEWEYYNSDHAFIAGKKAADAVLALLDAEAGAEALEGA